MISKFLTNDKWLSDYSLSCGYIETNAGYNDNAEFRLSLWKDSIYHVRLHHNDNGRIFWDSFDTLTEAREAFKRTLKNYNLKRAIPKM